jgi:hypothetical protein
MRDLPIPGSPETRTTPAVACLGLLPAAQEQVQLLLAPDQWRKRGRVLCLEAALHGARAKHLP